MARQKDDWYPTPPVATRRLLDVEVFDERVWEPAAGDGAICEVLRAACYNVVASDLVDYGYCDSGVDFLMTTRAESNSLVTNPPYKLAEQFIKHAIDLGVGKHAWLLRLSFLEGKGRHDKLFLHHPPSRIHVFSRRLTMWRGGEEPTSTGTTAYAWFVWSGCYNGATQLSWI